MPTPLSDGVKKCLKIGYSADDLKKFLLIGRKDSVNRRYMIYFDDVVNDDYKGISFYSKLFEISRTRVYQDHIKLCRKCRWLIAYKELYGILHRGEKDVNVPSEMVDRVNLW